MAQKEGAKLLLASLVAKPPRMAKLWIDSAYQALGEWLRSSLGWGLEQ